VCVQGGGVRMRGKGQLIKGVLLPVDDVLLSFCVCPQPGNVCA
jgi:hypothetical protein